MTRAAFSYDFPHRHLISVADLNPVDIRIIFERAAHWLGPRRGCDCAHGAAELTPRSLAE